MIGEELARIREPGVFIVDDVAFIQAEHGFAIGREIERRGIRKRYYLETRADVLMRNKEVFAYWKRLGLEYMFLGIEAIDEEGLKAHRKRATLSSNLAALDFARSLGITVAINIIADPDWDERRFAIIREWASGIPEIVNVSVNTPYPGTESFLGHAGELTTRDYRLFDIQHAVLPTRLPLDRFYAELVRTQQVLNRKHLGLAALKGTAVPRGAAAGARADQLRPHALALQQRLQPAAPARRPRAPRRVPDAPAVDPGPGCGRDPGRRRQALRPAPPGRALASRRERSARRARATLALNCGATFGARGLLARDRGAMKGNTPSREEGCAAKLDRGRAHRNARRASGAGGG